MHLIRQAWQLLLSLLHNAERQHRQIHSHDAPSHTFPLPLSRPPGAITAVPVGKQQPDTSRVHDTLLHRKPLLVVSTGDLEDVALELRAHAVGGDFVAHAVVHEDTELPLVFDLDEFLGAIGRVGDVELHLDGGEVGVKMVGS